MMELGSKAPDFTLHDTVSGNPVTLSEVKSDTATLVEIAKIYQAKAIQFIAISSNDIDYSPEDGPKYMTKIAKMEGYTFPYLYDATQAVAKAYNAECTPDFFVFDGNLECAYRGRFDETRPGMGQPTGVDLSNALDALIDGEKVFTDQKPSMGCSIKWK